MEEEERKNYGRERKTHVLVLRPPCSNAPKESYCERRRKKEKKK